MFNQQAITCVGCDRSVVSGSLKTVTELGSSHPFQTSPNSRWGGYASTYFARPGRTELTNMSAAENSKVSVRQSQSSRMNADNRLSLAWLGRVEGGDGIVESRDVADVSP